MVVRQHYSMPNLLRTAAVMIARRTIALYLLALWLGLALLAGCRTLPPLESRSISTALVDTGATRLGKAIAPLVGAHRGTSGVYPSGEWP
ncbi:MAG: hypothetical protein ACREQO_04000 [Candidatus Binatia bacterium]